MRPTSAKGLLVKDLLRKFPNAPTRTLAIKLYKEHWQLFKNVEEVRSFICYYRGASGKQKRKEIASKEFFKNPFKLPKTKARKLQVFHLPIEHNNILVLSDIHIPFHDIKALTTALNYGKEQNINCIFINGDLFDFFMISRFTITERRTSVKEELEIAREFLTALSNAFPNAPIYLSFGNHEKRLENYLAIKAPELLDVEEYKLENLLQVKNLTCLDDMVLVKMGKLAVTHGHKLLRGFFAPVNPSRGAFLRAKQSTLIGHLHKVSTHSETTINNKPITCYSTGCLCELNPDFNPFANSFSHGFAHVQFNKGGLFKVKNLQILDGEIIN